MVSRIAYGDDALSVSDAVGRGDVICIYCRAVLDGIGGFDIGGSTFVWRVRFAFFDFSTRIVDRMLSDFAVFHRAIAVRAYRIVVDIFAVDAVFSAACIGVSALDFIIDVVGTHGVRAVSLFAVAVVAAAAGGTGLATCSAVTSERVQIDAVGGKFSAAVCQAFFACISASRISGFLVDLACDGGDIEIVRVIAVCAAVAAVLDVEQGITSWGILDMTKLQTFATLREFAGICAVVDAAGFIVFATLRFAVDAVFGQRGAASFVVIGGIALRFVVIEAFDDAPDAFAIAHALSIAAISVAFSAVHAFVIVAAFVVGIAFAACAAVRVIDDRSDAHVVTEHVIFSAFAVVSVRSRVFCADGVFAMETAVVAAVILLFAVIGTACFLIGRVDEGISALEFAVFIANAAVFAFAQMFASGLNFETVRAIIGWGFGFAVRRTACRVFGGIETKLTAVAFFTQFPRVAEALRYSFAVVCRWVIFVVLNTGSEIFRTRLDIEKDLHALCGDVRHVTCFEIVFGTRFIADIRQGCRIEIFDIAGRAARAPFNDRIERAACQHRGCRT